MKTRNIIAGTATLALLLSLGGCSDEKVKPELKDASVESTQVEIKEADTIAKKIETSEVVKDIESLESSPEELRGDAPQGEIKDMVKDITGGSESSSDFTPPSEEDSEKIATPAPLKKVEGSVIYSKCVACHGAKADLKALGKSEPIAGWDAQKIVADLEGYKNGTINRYGMAASMKAIVSPLSKEDMEAVAEYISKF